MLRHFVSLTVIILLMKVAIAGAAAPPSAETQGEQVPGLFDGATSLAFDRDGTLWIGSYQSGVFAFRGGKFFLFDAYNTPIPDNGISAVYVDQNNTKWFGSRRGYLCSFDNRRWQVHPTAAEAENESDVGSIRFIRADGTGTVWFVPEDGGLRRFRNGKIELLAPGPRPGKAAAKEAKPEPLRWGLRQIGAVDFDRQGRLWVAVEGALLCYDGNAWSWLTNIRPHPIVLDIWCDRKSDDVYLATASGLYRFRDGKYQNVEAAEVPSRVDAVCGDSDGRLAAVCFQPTCAAVGDGVRFQRLATGKELTNDWLHGVALDKECNVWFAGIRSGLQCVTRTQWRTFAPTRCDSVRRDVNPRLVLERNYLRDLVLEEPADADIHEVLKDPRKYAGKKVRIVGRVSSGRSIIDDRDEPLGIAADILRPLWNFTDAKGVKMELRDETPKEFLGYLDWGGYFGHMGGWAREFTIIEAYPAGLDRAGRAEIRQRYLKHLEEVDFNNPIPDLVETPEICRIREALQGRWALTSLLGQNCWRLRGGVGDHWVFSGSRLKTGGPGNWSRAVFRLDPRRTPATIDCCMPDNALGEKRLRGIFALDRDGLKVCFSEGNKRPKNFDTDRWSSHRIFLLTRSPAALNPSYAEPVPPDDREAIVGLKKSSARLEYDEQGNVVSLDFGYVQGDESMRPALFALLNKLHHLERLDISSDRLADSDLVCIEHSSRLVRLDLYSKQLTDAGLEHLRGLVRLESLLLFAPSVTDAGLEKLSGLKALKNLEIYNSKVTGSGLAYLSLLPNLQTVRLDTCAVEDNVFQYATGLPELKTLMLNWTKAGDSMAHYLRSCRKLEGLGLCATRFGDAGMVHLGKVKTLKGLNLSETKLTDAGTEHLAGLEKLEALFLDKTQLGDTGVAHLRGLKNLKMLGLEGTRVTDAGLAYLTDLPNLEYLRLDGLPITNAGLDRLKRLPKLEELWLNDTRVDNAGLERLKSFPALRAVAVCRPRVTKEAAEALHAALSKVTVIYDNPGRPQSDK